MFPGVSSNQEKILVEILISTEVLVQDLMIISITICIRNLWLILIFKDREVLLLLLITILLEVLTIMIG